VMNVRVPPALDARAGRAFPASNAPIHRAIQGGCQGDRCRALAGTGRAQQEPRVSDLTGGDLTRQAGRRARRLERMPDAHSRVQIISGSPVA